MKVICILSIASVLLTAIVSPAYCAGPSDELARNAFKQILSQADTNKDGKLSLTECKAIYKDSSIAEKNCTFWDANHDGTITEDEYATQAMSVGRKK